MRYLRAWADTKGRQRWWVHAYAAVHPNMQSHTGLVLTLGGGAVYGSSTKQKLNTNSSTKAELVDVNDAFPQVLWKRHF